MDYAHLIARIDAHSAATGLKPSTICQYAASNPLLYERLISGGYCAPKTAQKVLEWIDQNAPKQAAE